MRCQFEWLQVREDGLHPCQGFSRGTERAWCSCSHTGCDRNWYERERVQYLQVAAWARPKQMSCHCFSGVQFPNSYKSRFGSYIPVQRITEFYSQEVIVGIELPSTVSPATHPRVGPFDFDKRSLRRLSTLLPLWQVTRWRDWRETNRRNYVGQVVFVFFFAGAKWISFIDCSCRTCFAWGWWTDFL